MVQFRTRLQPEINWTSSMYGTIRLTVTSEEFRNEFARKGQELFGLEARGYKDVPRDDTSAWNFVLGDDEGILVDVHAFHFDDKGNGIYGDKGETYPADSLKGTGTINGQQVKCVTADQLVKFHIGYEPDENDKKDVKALCEKFGIEVPKEYTDYNSPSR